MPLYFAYQQNWIACILLALCSCLVFYKHKENVNNLITKNGKEMKIRNVLLKKK